MAIKRIVDASFWTDSKVDEFSPEDKYFMLYLLTNPFTTQLGIYQISLKHVAFQLGYTPDSVKVLLERFERKYDMIRYCEETGEVAIKNYLRHSIVKGGAPVRDLLLKELNAVKNKELIEWVFVNLKDVTGLNETVERIILEYFIKRNKESNISLDINENENENENDNDDSLQRIVTTNRYEDAFAEFSGENTELLKAFRDFEQMRKKIRKPLSDEAKKRLITKLKSLSEDPNTQIKILNQSEDNCWLSVFALKQDAKPLKREYSSAELDFIKKLDEKYSV